MLSHRGQLAIAAVVDIAMHCASGPVKAPEIAERQGYAPRYLEPTLQALARAKLIKATRGPRGGYTCVRVRTTCSEIIRAVSFSSAFRTSRKRTSEARAIATIMGSAEQLFLDDLATTTVLDLWNRAKELGLAPHPPTP